MNVRQVCCSLFAFFLMASFAVVSANDDLPQLPSGPDGPGEFGAYYSHLSYSPQWDEPWRVADHPDVVVRFDNGGHKFVFWRGTSFIPCWVSDKDVWYTNEFVERRGHHSPNTEGCVEPMSDKQCRFSHVRVIESNNARVVVHWRYAPVDVRYEHPFIDPQTGWSDWVDEYYTIYPNAVGVRKITAYTNRPDLWMEFHEAIVVNQPGTMPDDNIDAGAVSVANMDGKSKTYVWTEDGSPEFDELQDANIFKINVKGSRQPFAAVSPPATDEPLITPYEGHGRGSKFNFWDHWPVSQVASDGRAARSAANPSHSSLCHFGLFHPNAWRDYEREEKKRVKLMLNGMTDKSAGELVPLVHSWWEPAEASVSEGGFTNKGYDRTQLAYVLVNENAGNPSKITMKIDASEESPMVTPGIVVEKWGELGVDVKMNGKSLTAGEDYRVGHADKLDGTNLVVWLNRGSTEPVTVSLTPSEN